VVKNIVKTKTKSSTRLVKKAWKGDTTQTGRKEKRAEREDWKRQRRKKSLKHHQNVGSPRTTRGRVQNLQKKKKQKIQRRENNKNNGGEKKIENESCRKRKSARYKPRTSRKKNHGQVDGVVVKGVA